MADEETPGAAGSIAGSSMKQKCCGSPSRRICSTLVILVCIVAIAMIAIYGTRTGVGAMDETHVQGTQGTCSNGTADASSIQVITMNTFMIYCIPGVDKKKFKCQEPGARTERAQSIGEWFKDRDEDVVLMQEIWSNHDVIRDGMTGAGFCHYVMTERKSGSGLAIFSKHPISEISFKDWFDAFGEMQPDPLNPESYVADKGVLYARVMKGNQPINIFNMHTSSDTNGDYHNVRLKQFNIVKEVVDSKTISKEELVLMGGDMNEDKDCRLMKCDRQAKCEDQTYYSEMLTTLSAGELEMSTETAHPWTYNTENNTLLKSLYEGSDCDTYQYLLDYIFYSKDHLTAKSSSVCEILNPLSEEGTDLSDHFPLSCAIAFEPVADPVTEGRN
ncbi:hypothetical protein ACHAXM_010301 [Skeletonema potamos]